MCWPSIHDITTDPDDPPAFAALLARRAGRGVSTPDYDGPAAAAAQRRAYADIQPLILPVPFARAFEAARSASEDLGWAIVAADAASGRIEAVATTRLLRFRDDVVVRIRDDERGARIDVRSKSRLGRGDLGTNARRIRRFLAQVITRAGVPRLVR